MFQLFNWIMALWENKYNYTLFDLCYIAKFSKCKLTVYSSAIYKFFTDSNVPMPAILNVLFFGAQFIE